MAFSVKYLVSGTSSQYVLRVCLVRVNVLCRVCVTVKMFSGVSALIEVWPKAAKTSCFV